MSKSILVVDTPKSCSECELSKKQCGNKNYELLKLNYIDCRPPHCPLQDTTELLEALEDAWVIMNDGLDTNEKIQKVRMTLNYAKRALGGK